MTNYEDSFPVEVLCTVVPEGLTTGQPSKQKISVVLSPYVAPSESWDKRCDYSLKQNTALPLQRLPEVVSTQEGGQFVLFLHRDSLPAKPIVLGHDSAVTSQQLSGVGMLWRRLFEDSQTANAGTSGFERFHAVLSDPTDSEQSLSKAASFASKLPSPELTQSFPIADLAEQFQGLHNTLLAVSLLPQMLSKDALETYLTDTLGDQVTSIEALTELYSEIETRPFSNDIRRAMWLTTLKKVFLSEGTDSPLGRLADLVPNDGGEGDVGFKAAAKNLNSPIADIARQFAGAPDVDISQSGVISQFSNAVRARRAAADFDLFDPLSLLGSFLPGTADGRARFGIQTFVDRFADDVAAYRDAHSFERAPRGVADPKMSRDTDEKKLREGVRRKLSELRAHPTLAKGLRQIHDFEVVFGPEDLAGVTAISAAFLKTDTDVVALSHDDVFLKTIFRTAVRADGGTLKLLSRRDALNESLASAEVEANGDSGGKGIMTPANFVRTFAIGQATTDKGLIDLRVPDRFHLNILDISQETHSTTARLQSANELAEAGATPQYTSFDMPHKRSRGIELVDEFSQSEAVFDIAVAEVRRAAKTASCDRDPLYAEDLQTGVRIDVLHTANGQSVETFHPAMARQVFYPGLNKVLGLKADEHPFKNFAYRDEGYAAQLSRIRDNGDDPDTAKKTAIVSPRIVFWTGEPAGMPGHGSEVEVHDRKLALATDIVYEPPSKPSWPVLREYDEYRMVARPRLLNGGGPEFLFGEASESNKRIYRDSALGATQAGAIMHAKLRFAPPDVIGAPEVLLLPDDPLLDPAMDKPVLPDKVKTIVVRTYETPKAVTRAPVRIVAPPHISFEQAEQQGQFDGSNRARPVGNAFMAKVEWDPDISTFPHTKVTHQTVNGNIVVNDDPEMQVRGPIFRGAKTDQNYYFIDDRINAFGLSLEDNGRPPSNPKKNTRTHVSTIYSKISADRVPPVMVSFYPEMDSDYGNWIDTNLTAQRLQAPGRKSVTVDHIGIHLLPGAELELNLTCPLDAETVLRRTYFGRQLGLAAQNFPNQANLTAKQSSILSEYLDAVRLLANAAQDDFKFSPGQDKAWLDKIWRSAFVTTPSDILNAIEKVSLVHAVQKPTKPPVIPRKSIPFAFPNKESVHEKTLRALRFVRRTEGPDDWTALLTSAPEPEDPLNDTAYRNAWIYGIPSVRSLDNQIWSDAAHLEDVEGSTLAYLVGEVELDRNTTRALRCEMLYRDVSAPAAKVVDHEGNWQYRPKVITQNLFEIRDIKKEVRATPGHVDLGFADDGTARQLSLDAGTQARRVAIRMVATSRFDDFFEENLPDPNAPEADSDPGVESFELAYSEKENAPHDVLEAALHQHNCPRIDPELVIFEEEYWIKSTRRPPRPDITNMILTRDKREVSRDETTIVEEHRTGLRLELGDYAASGEGELIALVMLPPNLVSEYPLSCPADGDVMQREHVLSGAEHAMSGALKDVTMDGVDYEGLLGRSVTAWGTDPTTSSGFLDPVILPSQFAGWSMKKSNLSLPLANADTFSDAGQDADGDPQQPVYPKVAVIGYAPVVNERTGTWQVDMDIDATRADSPFFRISVSRCQLQCLDDLELSAPTILPSIRIPPRRWVEVSLQPGRTVRASVTGVGYTRRDPAFEIDELPEGEKAFEKLKSDADVPHQNFRLQRRAGPDSFVQVYDANGTAVEAHNVLPVQRDAGLEWIVEFAIPEGVDPSDLRLTIFETELKASDIDENPLKDIAGDNPRAFATDIDLGVRRLPIDPVEPPEPPKTPKK